MEFLNDFQRMDYERKMKKNGALEELAFRFQKGGEAFNRATEGGNKNGERVRGSSKHKEEKRIAEKERLILI